MTAPARRPPREVLLDGLRLSFGTLTVLPVPSPRTVDRGAAAVAMLASVLPGAVLGAVAGGTAVALAGAGAPPLAAGAAAVAAGALATRVLHLDGLADTADGLAVHGPPERALEVMRRGDVGPAGASALLLVLLAQAAAVAAVVGSDGPWPTRLGTLVLAWAVSRAVLPLLTARGTRPARAGGLGAGVLGSVPRSLAGLPLLLLAVAGAALARGGAVTAVVAVAGGALAAALVALVAYRRLGGLSGDVLGAGVEVSLATALTVLAAG
ncbi:adenosylcobinamide-GDP ribazoletransferase [Aquipuribacter sp. SD81]|uniref:adenosylcobinamide-GDP ribazoletransferase n=1 Tax=Aquipuribacter sp. SD81 TaxID=3127703 RepID=UPI00301665FB